MATPDTNSTPQFNPAEPYYSSAEGQSKAAESETPNTPTFDPNQPYTKAPPQAASSGSWESFKSRMMEPVKMEEIEQIPGLQPDVVENLKEQGLAAGQPTLRKIFGTEQGDAIREHIMFGFSPEVFARAAGKTLTDWYSPAMLAMSIPGRIAHGYQAAAEAAEHAGLIERAGVLANKARLAGAIGTVSGVPFVAKQVNGLIDNWDGMSPEERIAGLSGVLGGSILGVAGAHEAIKGHQMQARLNAESQKYAEPVATNDYPVRVYNGTSADVGSIEDLDAKYSLPRATAGPGVYLSRDPQVASEYVKNSPGARVLGGVMRNDASLLNAQQELPSAILKERGLPQGTSYLDALKIIREDAGPLEDAVPEIKSLQRELARQGYHGVDNLYGNRDVVAIFGNDILPEGQKYKDLIKSGVPSKGGNFVAESAQRYNAANGNPEINHEAPPVDHDRAQRLAEEMDTHVHEPENPRVKDAYENLIRDVKAQWNHAVNDLHMKLEPSEEDPYSSYEQVKDDVLNNRRLKIYTGGNPLPPDHPLAAVDPQTGLTYNTMLRGVHDLFGHVAGDNDFSEGGEAGATDAHRQMMSPKSVPALLNETEGQVSQFFHGKAKGNFPPQNATIVPNEFLGKSFAAVANKTGEEHPYITAMKEKYGSHNDPDGLLIPGASFLHPDGRYSFLGATEHPQAIKSALGPGVKVDKAKFLNDTGSVRVRFSHDHGGDTLHISVPKQGVTEDQVSMLRQAVAKNRYGNFVLERSDITPETQGRRGKVVEFAKPLDFSNALREIGAHPEQGPHKSWIDKTLKEMDEHTAGAFDPHTGKEDTTGAGVEIYPEARAERKALQHKPTEEELMDFYTDNKDLFVNHPELRIGWDKTDKGWELNIGASGTREGAIKAGNKLDQRAAWDIEGKKEIPLQGKGQQQEFRDYPLADRLRDLKGNVIEPGSQKAIAERPEVKAPRGSSIDLLENPIPKTSEELSLFADKVHRGMTISGTAISDFQKAMGRWVRDVAGEITKPSAVLKRSISIAENEINHWMMENGGEGLGWYKKMTDAAIGALKELHPNLEDPSVQSIFKALWTAHSYGTKPTENMEQAERNFTNFEKTGKIEYDQGYNDPITGEPKKWSGHSGNVYTLAKTQHLVDTMGVDGAAQWLTSKHTWPEIKEVFDKAGLNVSKSGIPFFPDGTTYGSMAFGPKGGAFFLNLNGIHDFTTVDIWGARALRRWEGRLGQEDTLSTDPKTGLVSDEPPSTDEIERFHKVIDTIGKKMGLDNGDVQALQWYYEHKLYEVHGVGEEARDYEKAAKEVAKRRENGDTGKPEVGGVNALEFLGIKPGVRSGENAEEGEEAARGRKNADTGELFEGNEKRGGREPGEEGPEEVVKPEQQKEIAPTIEEQSNKVQELTQKHNEMQTKLDAMPPMSHERNLFVNEVNQVANELMSAKMGLHSLQEAAKPKPGPIKTPEAAEKYLREGLPEAYSPEQILNMEPWTDRQGNVTPPKEHMANETEQGVIFPNGEVSFGGSSYRHDVIAENFGLDDWYKMAKLSGTGRLFGMGDSFGVAFNTIPSEGQIKAVNALAKAWDVEQFSIETPNGERSFGVGNEPPATLPVISRAMRELSAAKKAEGVIKPEQQKALQQRLVKNRHYPGTVLDDIYHELGHIVVGEHVGVPSADGVRTDQHSETTGVASMAHDFSGLGANKNGDLPFKNASKHVDKLLIASMGGGAAEEVLSGTPMSTNKGMSGDLAQARGLLEDMGYTPAQARVKVEAAKQAAKDILTREGVSDIMKKYAADREEGLPVTHHMSQERADEMMKEIYEHTKRQNQEGREAAGNIGGRAGATEGVREEVDTGAKGGGASRIGQEATQLKLPGFQKKKPEEREFSGVPVGAGFLAGGGPKIQEKETPGMLVLGKNVPGMLVPGTIDLNNRPIVHNDDGSLSTEYSTSFSDDKGREVLVPTVVNGRFLTPDGKKPREGSPEEKAMFRRAAQQYRETGQHMGIFDTPEHADAYAVKVHNRQDTRYKAGASVLSGRGPVDIPRRLDEVADEFGIPKEILQAQARKESNLNPNAISKKGAKGVMQLMDRTSHDLGVKDPFDPEENIRGGARYLSDLHRRLGYWDRALAAYNWGPDRVKDVVELYGPAWLEHTPKETQDYVRKILQKHQK